MYIEYGGAALLLLLVMFVLVSHWFACIWYTIGVAEANNGVTYGWLQTLGRDIDQPFVAANDSSGHGEWIGGPSGVMAYVTALYFTLSCMTSVGFGNVSASTQSEKIFSIFMMIFGGEQPMDVVKQRESIYGLGFSVACTGIIHDFDNTCCIR